MENKCTFHENKSKYKETLLFPTTSATMQLHCVIEKEQCNENLVNIEI
jgi:hypothetical protein